MIDIFHDLPINASAEWVFQAISQPAGLDQWWTRRSTGSLAEGAIYELDFGPDHQWQARIIRLVPNTELVFEMTRADDDWTGTRVSFQVEGRGEVTWLRFCHAGWASPNEHFRISTHCWGLYLRILRRYLEHGETVPYAERLQA